MTDDLSHLISPTVSNAHLPTVSSDVKSMADNLNIPEKLSEKQRRVAREEFGPCPKWFKEPLITKEAKENPFALQTKALVESELAALRRH